MILGCDRITDYITIFNKTLKIHEKIWKYIYLRHAPNNEIIEFLEWLKLYSSVCWSELHKILDTQILDNWETFDLNFKA